MTNQSLSCADDQTAELYAMNRLNAVSAEMFEEHLLVCSQCVDLVEGAQEYIALFRAAVTTVQ